MNIQPTANSPISAELTKDLHKAPAAPVSPPVAAPDQHSASQNTGTHPASAKDVQSAVDKVQSFIEKQSVTDLSFSVDDQTNIRVVKVVDRNTNEVIRQIPSEEMLQMAQTLDKLQGLLLKQKA